MTSAYRVKQHEQTPRPHGVSDTWDGHAQWRGRALPAYRNRRIGLRGTLVPHVALRTSRVYTIDVRTHAMRRRWRRVAGAGGRGFAGSAHKVPVPPTGPVRPRGATGGAYVDGVAPLRARPIPWGCAATTACAPGAGMMYWGGVKLPRANRKSSGLSFFLNFQFGVLVGTIRRDTSV